MSAIADSTRPPLSIEFPEEEVYSISELGEGLSLRSRRTVELTPKFALDFMEYAEFYVGDEKVDRKLQESHVIHLAREMLSGSFLWEQVNLVLCQHEGREYRLNGQHTCWARLYADEQGFPKEARTPVQLLRYEAKTIQDMRRLYASIDSGKPRTMGNKLSAFLAGTSEIPFRKAVIKELSQGLSVWLWESGTVRTLHGADDRAYMLLRDHNTVACNVGTFLSDSKPADLRHIKRAPVVGAMFETFNKSTKEARDFWEVVRDGIGITDKEDPRYLLRSYLLAKTLSKAHPKTGRVVSQEEMYRACLVAWNAHRAGRRIKHLRVDMETARPVAR